VPPPRAGGKARPVAIPFLTIPGTIRTGLFSPAFPAGYSLSADRDRPELRRNKNPDRAVTPDADSALTGILAREVMEGGVRSRATIDGPFPDPVGQPPDLPVLEDNDPVIDDEQDPVIGYGFLPIAGPDRHIIRFQADLAAARTGPVIGYSPVDIPHLYFCRVIAVVVPVLLQEFMAGQHDPSLHRRNIRPRYRMFRTGRV
jgi:hypothetical protein